MVIDYSSVVVVNEVSSADVDLFEDSSVAANYLEAIDVINEEFVAFTLYGHRLELSTTYKRVWLFGEIEVVRICPSSDDEDYSALVRGLLVETAKRILEVTKRALPGDPHPAELPIEKLVEIVGFTR